MKKLLFSVFIVCAMSWTYNGDDDDDKKGVCADRVGGGVACVLISGTKNCNSQDDCKPM